PEEPPQEASGLPRAHRGNRDGKGQREPGPMPGETVQVVGPEGPPQPGPAEEGVLGGVYGQGRGSRQEREQAGPGYEGAAAQAGRDPAGLRSALLAGLPRSAAAPTPQERHQCGEG